MKTRRYKVSEGTKELTQEFLGDAEVGELLLLGEFAQHGDDEGKLRLQEMIQQTPKQIRSLNAQLLRSTEFLQQSRAYVGLIGLDMAPQLVQKGFQHRSQLSPGLFREESLGLRVRVEEGHELPADVGGQIAVFFLLLAFEIILSLLNGNSSTCLRMSRDFSMRFFRILLPGAEGRSSSCSAVSRCVFAGKVSYSGVGRQGEQAGSGRPSGSRQGQGQQGQQRGGGQKGCRVVHINKIQSNLLIPVISRLPPTPPPATRPPPLLNALNRSYPPFPLLPPKATSFDIYFPYPHPPRRVRRHRCIRSWSNQNPPIGTSAHRSPLLSSKLRPYFMRPAITAVPFPIFLIMAINETVS